MIVTDHAVIRYLERVWGVDIAHLRTRIGREATPHWPGPVDAGPLAGCDECRVVAGDVKYTFRRNLAGEPMLVTITVNNEQCLSKRARRLRRRTRGQK